MSPPVPLSPRLTASSFDMDSTFWLLRQNVLMYYFSLALMSRTHGFVWPRPYLDAMLPAAGDIAAVTLSPHNNSQPCTMASRMLLTNSVERLDKSLERECDYSGLNWYSGMLDTDRMWSMQEKNRGKKRSSEVFNQTTILHSVDTHTHS